jgi:hypothetical protein
MGCDIHLHVEIKIDGVWEHYAHPNISRNYALFARMAGVRGNDYIKPIALPKGTPKDMTKVTRLDFEAWGADAHSASWLGLRDIVMLEGWLDGQNWGDSALSTSLEHTILHTYLFGSSFSSLVLYPDDNRVQGLEDVRFVFWFDN